MRGKRISLWWVVILIWVLPSITWGWKVPGIGKPEGDESSSKTSGTPVEIAQIATDIHGVKEAFLTATYFTIDAKMELIGMVENKEAIIKLKDQLEQAKKIEDPKEKDAEIIRIQKETDEKFINSVTEEKIELTKLSEEQKQSLLRIFKNLTLATLKDKETLIRVEQLSKDAPVSLDAAKANKMAAVKEASNIKYVTDAAGSDIPQMLKDIPAQITAIGSSLNSVTKLAINNKVNLPKPESVKVTDSFES